jgi:hypothetical protein
MPGLELIGTIAGAPKTPSPSELERGFEELGMFILGDASDARAYSGPNLGSRWLCRLQGFGLELPIDWPDGITWKFWPDEAGAHGMYARLRQHIHDRFPGVEARDVRGEMPLNVPSAIAESFSQNGSELFRMFSDNMADLQIAVRHTDCIRRFPAYPTAPDGPAFANYFSQNDPALYVAIARGPSGAAQHVLLVFSPKHEPEPVIPQGMPRAERVEKKTTKAMQLRSGILLAFWGRVPGASIVAPAGQNDPAAMLHSFLGNRVAAPLQSNVPGLDERLAAPAAWAIRVEPGDWQAHFYLLDANAGEGYSFLALSKVGAPSFQPAQLGNAGGKIIGGLTLEQYAMLQCERDAILVQYQGGSGPQLAALCQKYSLPVPTNAMGVDVGYAARVVEWDQAIQGNASLSAQYVAQRSIAAMRLQGIEPNEQMVAQVAAQQQQVQDQLKAANKAHADAGKELVEGAHQIIELARGKTPAQIIEAARGIFAHEMRSSGTPAYGLGRAITILKQPGYKGNPKFANVDQMTDALARAHYQTMKPEDQKLEGKEDKYVKSVIADVYEKNGLPVPGVGGFLGRFMDKI